MTISTLQTLLETLEQDDSLRRPEQLRQRIEVLDRIETYLIHGQHQEGEDAALHRRAQAMCADLEATNRELYQSIRRKIQQGSGAGTLFEWVNAWSDAARPLDHLNGIGYDFLDVLVSGVLQFEEPGDRVTELTPDMLFYQPTPARDIFDFISRAELGEKDVVIDLGSGLGHVSLLTAICTRARCVGIELEAAYVDCANKCAQSLNLHNATFIAQDVRSADFSSGTVFYFYTPFSGAILRHVLDMLKREAANREIRLCTLGPCTPVIGEEPWLKAVGTPDIDRVAIFHSV